MRFLIVPLACFVLAGSSFAQEFTVLTDAASLRALPDSKEIIGTLNKDYSQGIFARFNFWAKGEKGWIDLDFTSYSQPLYVKTGKITLKLFQLKEDVNGTTENGTIYLPANSLIIVAKEEKNSVIGSFEGKAVEVSKSAGTLKIESFEIAVLTAPVVLTSEDNYETCRLKAGTPVLLSNDGRVFYKNSFWSLEKEQKNSSFLDKEQIISDLNHLIDIYNSAKFSSPIAERLGYYVKTLPLKDEDVSLVETSSGVGIVIKLKHRFFMNNGKPINDRRTRLIFKKSNFDFWSKLAKSCFDNGINKFVEIEIYRYDPEKSDYDNQGFIAFSYHLYKEGKYKNYKQILDYSDSDLNDDLWFFADEVYERIENGD